MHMSAARSAPIARLVPTVAAALAALVLVTAPASAQQTVNFTFGGFVPRGYDARVRDDVLVANRDFLLFEISDFHSVAVGGEWLLPFGRFVEGGVGLSYTSDTVPSVYADFVDSDGTEIDQKTQLRRVPVDFTVRVLPFSNRSPIQPYVGAGLTAIRWRYSEFGEFIDFDAGRRVFEGEFTADGTRAGLVALGGVRFAISKATAGFELRYYRADAPLDDRFAGSRLDLGGWTYQATGGFRF
jgi:opacity protein-like surface antigen